MGNTATVIFNKACLEQLQASASKQDFHELVDLWLASIERKANRIAELFAERNWVHLQREAHTLIGTAGSLGASRLEEAARSLLDACARASESEADKCVRVIQSVTRQTINTVHDRFPKAPPDKPEVSVYRH